MLPGDLIVLASKAHYPYINICAASQQQSAGFFQESILNLNCLSVKLVQSGFILITAAIGSCWWVMEDVLLL